MIARRVVTLGVLLALLTRTVHAQQPPPPTKDIRFAWDPARKNVYITALSFREVADAKILRKLSRGLPTTIVFTATIWRPGIPDAISHTLQTCKITFQVWDEIYIVERTRPGRTERLGALVPEKAISICTDVGIPKGRPALLAGTSAEVPVGAPLYLQATALANPVSPQVLEKLKRWVSRPSGTGTPSPGDALFSTFTGLFLQRLGNAERELKFTTKIVRPILTKP